MREKFCRLKMKNNPMGYIAAEMMAAAIYKK